MKTVVCALVSQLHPGSDSVDAGATWAASVRVVDRDRDPGDESSSVESDCFSVELADWAVDVAEHGGREAAAATAASGLCTAVSGACRLTVAADGACGKGNVSIHGVRASLQRSDGSRLGELRVFSRSRGSALSEDTARLLHRFARVLGFLIQVSSLAVCRVVKFLLFLAVLCAFRV